MAATHHFHIDGKWIAGQPAFEFGSLGLRYLCVLGESPGQPSKQLLLRYNVWPQANAPAGTPSLPLTLGVLAKNDRLLFRPVSGKKYQECITRDDGKQKTQSPHVLQQDVTGLISLRQAIGQALERSEPQKVWRLFYNACEALDRLGKAAETQGLVPLQCPDSLAVGPNDEIVPLDAEIRVFPPIPPGSEAGRLYATWFGSSSTNGVADARNAALLHAEALLRYFRQVLGVIQQKGGADGAHAAVVLGQARDLPAGKDLGELEDFLGTKSTDWNIWVEDEAVSVVATASKRSPGVPLTPPKRKSLLLRVSLCVNLMLAIVILLLLLLRGKSAPAQIPPGKNSPTGEDNRELGPSASSLRFSSYCVIFPTQGTIGDKVKASLDELFPGKVIELKRSDENGDQLLLKKRSQTIQSLKEPAKLEQLLTKLANDHAVRFKGFSVTEPRESLGVVIERGGLFTITTASGEQHGSLLQTNSLERVLRQAGLENDRDAAGLLDGLSSAIVEYASLRDALGLVGSRNAFLVRVDATEPAHEKLRFHLLSRLQRPVFISRPLTELFDAVDPTADSGGGSAAYVLQLDRKCFWREAGQQDRVGVDYSRNDSNDLMKWVSFNAGQPIRWKPIPLTKFGGRTLNVSTFDIAIPTGKQVVVFRNQFLLLGTSREKVIEQARTYIETILKLKVGASEDIVSVRFQDGQYTGTLTYSFLADQVPMSPSSEDLQVMPLEMFQMLLTTEDGAVRAP